MRIIKKGLVFFVFFCFLHVSPYHLVLVSANVQEDEKLGQNDEILLPRIAGRDVNAIGRAGMGGRGGSGTSSGGRTGAGTYGGANKNGGTYSSASTSSYSSGMGMAAFAAAGAGNKRNGASSLNDCKVVGFGLSATKIAVVTPFVLLLGSLWL